MFHTQQRLSSDAGITLKKLLSAGCFSHIMLFDFFSFILQRNRTLKVMRVPSGSVDVVQGLNLEHSAALKW